MGEQTGASSTRWGGFRLLLMLLGTVMIIGGVWVLADSYAADYDCFNELRCHNEGSRSPSAADRAAAALGFGLEHPGPTAIRSPVRRARSSWRRAWRAGSVPSCCDRPVARRRRAVPSTVHPLSPEQQLAQYERLRDRGTLTDAEFEDRGAIGSRRSRRPRADVEPSS